MKIYWRSGGLAPRIRWPRYSNVNHRLVNLSFRMSLQISCSSNSSPLSQRLVHTSEPGG